MACHQNGGPIFSLPGWDETNANAQVAAAIVKARGREFFGVGVANQCERQAIHTSGRLDDVRDVISLSQTGGVVFGRVDS